MPIRPVRSSDYPGINVLHRSVWWQERSLAGWQWMAGNPAHADIDAPAGLMAEGSDGEPIAFLGNFIQRFWRGDELFHGATGYSLIVSRAARGRSRSLVMGLVNQPGVFASYIFNANPKAAGIYQKMGLNPWPEKTHAMKLSWVVDPVVCLEGWALRKLAARRPDALDFSREWLMNDRLARDPDLRLPDDVRVIRDLSDASDYAAFWDGLKSEQRLMADRGPATLRWRMADPDHTTAPVLLGFYRQGQMTGYAMAQMSKGNTIDPAFLEIIDIMALEHENEAIPALMKAVISNARRLGAAKVRLQILNERLLDRLGSFATSARREGGWGHCFVAFRQGGPDPASWAPTPFDGDYGVCARNVPLNRSSARRASSTLLDGQVSHA
jgi:hypothetical protein